MVGHKFVNECYLKTDWSVVAYKGFEVVQEIQKIQGIQKVQGIRKIQGIQKIKSTLPYEVHL